MHDTSGPEHWPYLLLNKAEVPSNSRLNSKGSVRLQTSKLDISRSGLNIPKTTISNLTRKSTKDAGVNSITESSTHTPSSPKQGDQTLSPLRLALARRSVKQQIFTYMDQGDKKTDIESRTGLSHNCIKWHRRLWRDECSHPRPLSKKLSRSSARGPRTPGTRSERSLSGRSACAGKGDSMVAGRSGGDKTRRKHRAKKRSKERSVRAGMEMHGSRGMKFAERETTESGCLAGKENCPERYEAMAVSGDLKPLPCRDLRLERGDLR